MLLLLLLMRSSSCWVPKQQSRNNCSSDSNSISSNTNNSYSPAHQKIYPLMLIFFKRNFSAFVAVAVAAVCANDAAVQTGVS